MYGTVNLDRIRIQILKRAIRYVYIIVLILKFIWVYVTCDLLSILLLIHLTLGTTLAEACIQTLEDVII